MSIKDHQEERRKRLVKNLRMEGIIRSAEVEKAMLDVPREAFVPGGMRIGSYEDRPLPIGGGQTISAPHMVAMMSEEMDIQEGMKIMEIGTGSGYHAAVTSRLVGDEGRVYSVERIDKLVKQARRNLSESGIENVTVVEGDGSVGIPQEAPFDRIYYTCAAPDIPDIIKDQVKEGGSILAPIGPKQGTQRLIRLTRKGEQFEEERLTYCMFVPLVGEKGY